MGFRKATEGVLFDAITKMGFKIRKQRRNNKWMFSCTVCGRKRWKVDPHYSLAITDDGNPIVNEATSAALTMIAVICRNCGAIQFFSAEDPTFELIEPDADMN